MSKLTAALDFRVDEADFERDLADIRAVREPVFLIEQQVPPELEWDDLDPLSRHVVARDLGGRAIGTGRLTPEHRIGRMAVLADWRGRGVGGAMLSRLLDLAIELGYPKIELHSQVHAIPFYARAGFVAEGPEYLEAGIPHQNMRKPLPQHSLPERRPLPQAQEHAFESREDCRRATLALLKQAQHRLWILSHDLDPPLLCTEEALAELRRICVSGRRAQVRIVVQDPTAALRPAAALVQMAQRLTSTLEIRAPTDEVDINYPSAFVLDDTGGYLFRPIGSQFEGSTHVHGAGRNRQLRQLFEQVWERSTVPTELRALKL